MHPFGIKTTKKCATLVWNNLNTCMSANYPPQVFQVELNMYMAHCSLLISASGIEQKEFKDSKIPKMLMGIVKSENTKGNSQL